MSERHDEPYHAALASPIRRRVLDALDRSPNPIEAAAVADAVGLHVTTARFHLNHLEQVGLVRRAPTAEKRRGRPRILYTAVDTDRDENARAQLIDVLAAALADGDDPVSGRAEAAGRAWARRLAPQASQSDAASRTRTLLETLDQLGFDPASDERGVWLRACPFRDAARRHPEVVCAIHRGLVRQVLGTDLHGSRRDVQLLPFVEPNLCLITSRR